MGEMADFALDCAEDEVEHYFKYRDAPLDIQYDEGLIDEYGFPFGDVEIPSGM